jgi:hypothetical protein
VTGGQPGSGRLTTGQVIVWLVVFAAIVALVVLFFRYGRQVPALMSLLPAEIWLTSWS